MTEIQITEHVEQPTAGVREQVPMGQLSEFFSRAFAETLAALESAGVTPTGPPFGKYYGMPTDTVDVEAGYPVATAITPTGNVVPGSLPAGRVVEAVHVGPYDSIRPTYDEVQRYLSDANLTPGTVMWESYLSDPAVDDPASWRTMICWPVS